MQVEKQKKHEAIIIVSLRYLGVRFGIKAILLYLGKSIM